MRHLFLFFALIGYIRCTAQWTDDFSDNEFLQYPAWSGDTGDFIVNADQELQLSAVDPGTSYLSAHIPMSDLDSMEWRFTVRMAFSPSSSNYARVYLVSDREDFSGNGYFLQFGEALSNDAVELFRQDSSQFVSVLRAQDGQIASAFALSVKVTRDEAGVWRLYIDPSCSGAYQFAGLGAEGSYSSSSFLGIRCTYTSSNATRFYFDDFYAGPFRSDTETTLAYPPHAVLFNEIYFEPSADALIPPIEFVELVNRSNDTVHLQGWRITDGSTEARLPANSSLAPGGFAIVCKAQDATLFPADCPVLPAATFPSLNNDIGDQLELLSSRGQPIDRVRFSDDTYHDASKSYGGWTLERIDTTFLCADEGNWTASLNFAGGTPGKNNSVAGGFVDAEEPWIVSAWPENSHLIHVNFSEYVDSLVPGSLSIRDDVGSALIPESVLRISDCEFAVSFQNAFAGALTVRPYRFVTDCPGNFADTLHSVRASIGESPAAGDLVINELLYDAVDGISDFIELLNRSGKVIDLINLSVAETDFLFTAASGAAMPLIRSHRLIFPGETIAWTEQVPALRSAYASHDKYRLIACPDLPDFNADRGGVLLISASGDTIDRMRYSSEWHYPLLSDDKGISLERIDAGLNSMQRETWHSAATTCGGATPGRANSQAAAVGEYSSELEPESRVFTPNNDGRNDQLVIRYRFPDPGRLLNVRIFSESGRMVRALVNNSLAGNEGVIVWDGTDDSGFPAIPGRYVLFAETLSLTGEVRRYKQGCGVAGSE
ncbi:MAG: hypothetical protein RL213_1027 [Bacteroidota bacterium]